MTVSVIDRRAFLAGSLAIFVAPLAAEAQQAGKFYRLGFLGITSLSDHSPQITALREGLRDGGYQEGANLTIEYRWAEGKLSRLPHLAAEIVGLKVDLTHGSPGARAAKQATATIPIVMAAVSDPVRSGVIASLARPGGNVTGISLQDTEVTMKRLELVKQTFPKISRIGFMRVRGVQSVEAEESIWNETVAAARVLGVAATEVSLQGADDLARAFSLASQQDLQAIHVSNTSVLRAHGATIAALAVKHRLPTVSASSFAAAGILIGYSASLPDAAGYIARILNGARPNDLPVEQPSKFELVINLKTAKALGLTIPPSLLLRADQVIE